MGDSYLRYITLIDSLLILVYRIIYFVGNYIEDREKLRILESPKSSYDQLLEAFLHCVCDSFITGRVVFVIPDDTKDISDSAFLTVDVVDGMQLPCGVFNSNVSESAISINARISVLNYSPMYSIS